MPSDPAQVPNSYHSQAQRILGETGVGEGPKVIWVTGISGSGKTTLCRAIWDLLKPGMPQLVMLDGDMIREAFGSGLGYREKDRVVQINRIQRFAKMLSDQRLTVLVAALYANPQLLSWNHANIKGYFEVYLEVSLDTVRRRDTRGLYDGVTENVVGVDIPWWAPENPDMVINSDLQENPGTLAQRVIEAAGLFTECKEAI